MNKRYLKCTKFRVNKFTKLLSVHYLLLLCFYPLAHLHFKKNDLDSHFRRAALKGKPSIFKNDLLIFC